MAAVTDQRALQKKKTDLHVAMYMSGSYFYRVREHNFGLSRCVIKYNEIH